MAFNITQYMQTPADIAFWAIAGFFVVSVLLYFFARKYFHKMGRFLKKVPLLGKLGKRIMPILLLASAFAIASPFNPITGDWIFNWQFGNIVPSDVNPSGSHLVYTGMEERAGIDVTFNIINGFDVDGAYASATFDSITWFIYSGTVGMNPLTAEYWEIKFLEGEINMDTFFANAGWIQIDEGTASSGVGTSTKNLMNSGQVYILRLGSYSADASANDPLKSQLFKAVCQGSNDATVTTVNLGTGVFAYFGQVDADTDLSITTLDEAYAATTATTEDLSDQVTLNGGTFVWNLRVTFAAAEYGLQSYWDHANDQWWNWYVIMHFTESNTTGLDTIEALSVSSPTHSSSFLILPGAAAGGGGDYNFVMQLTTPHIYTSNDHAQIKYSYETDAAGFDVVGHAANHLILVRADMSSLTSIGVTDNDTEFTCLIDIGSEANLMALLARGFILADASTGEPFHQDGAATLTIVV